MPDSDAPVTTLLDIDDDVQLLSDDQTTVSESRASSEAIVDDIPKAKTPQRLSLKESTKTTPRQRSSAGILKNTNKSGSAKSIEHNGQMYTYYERRGDQVKYRCAQWSTKGCRAQLHTNVNGERARVGASAHRHDGGDSQASEFDKLQFNTMLEKRSTLSDGGSGAAAEILKHGGFTYKLHEETAGRTLYICAYGVQCQAQVETDDHGDVITVIGDHSHNDSADVKSECRIKRGDTKASRVSTKQKKQKRADTTLNNTRIGVSRSKCSNMREV